MPKIVTISSADEKNIADLRNKQTAGQVAKQYRISTNRVYDIWKRFNVYGDNLEPVNLDNPVKPANEQIESYTVEAGGGGEYQKIIDEQKVRIEYLEDIVSNLNRIIADQKNKIDNFEIEFIEQENKHNKVLLEHKDKINKINFSLSNIKREQELNNEKISDLCRINHKLTLAAAQYYMTKK